jgi:hypothetical protein
MPPTRRVQGHIALGLRWLPSVVLKKWLRRDTLWMEKPERRGRKQCRSRTEDEAVIFEDFFATSLHMSPHPTLADILLKFQAQLHQLTPNAIAQLSNYFWAVGSFSGVPSGDAFVKWYELHYQPKKVETAEGCLFVQYGCLNFHVKRDDRPKLSLTVKNK